MLEPNAPLSVDMDGDGKEDTVLFAVTHDDEYHPKLRITLAADPANTLTYTLQSCNKCMAMVVDFEPEVKGREIVFAYDQTGDYSITAFHLKSSGDGFKKFEMALRFGSKSIFNNGLPANFKFEPAKGLPAQGMTDVLGDYYVDTRFRVTEKGILPLNSDQNYFHFSYPDSVRPLKLKTELRVKLENGSYYTVPEGAEIIPRYTDRFSYVKVELPDGRMGSASVEHDSYYGTTINGVRQDYYADLPHDTIYE